LFPQAGYRYCRGFRVALICRYVLIADEAVARILSSNKIVRIEELKGIVIYLAIPRSHVDR